MNDNSERYCNKLIIAVSWQGHCYHITTARRTLICWRRNTSIAASISNCQQHNNNTARCILQCWYDTSKIISLGVVLPASQEWAQHCTTTSRLRPDTMLPQFYRMVIGSKLTPTGNQRNTFVPKNIGPLFYSTQVGAHLKATMWSPHPHIGRCSGKWLGQARPIAYRW